MCKAVLPSSLKAMLLKEGYSEQMIDELLKWYNSS
jgi:hypothetical protein